MSKSASVMRLDSKQRQLGLGLLVLLIAILAAFFWTEHKLTSSLYTYEHTVTPVQKAKSNLEQAIGALVVLQTRAVTGRLAAIEQLEKKQKRFERKLNRARAIARNSARNLAHQPQANLSSDWITEFDQTIDAFVTTNHDLLYANHKLQKASISFDETRASVDQELVRFLEMAQSFLGKLRFTDGSALRAIRRDFDRAGFNKSVRTGLKRKFIAGSSRKNRMAVDSLFLAATLQQQLNRLRTCQNKSELDTSITPDIEAVASQLNIVLEDLRSELPSQKALRSSIEDLLVARSNIIDKIIGKKEAASLLSKKQNLLAAHAHSRSTLANLNNLAQASVTHAQKLVYSVEKLNAPEQLRMAGTAMRWVLLSIAAIILIASAWAGHSFNSGIASLRSANHRLTHSRDRLAVLNKGLERDVSERTNALEWSHRTLKLFYEESKQGFAILDSKAQVIEIGSARLQTWLGQNLIDSRFDELIGQYDSSKGEQFRNIWTEPPSENISIPARLSQLPTRINAHNRNLSIDYKVIEVKDSLPEHTLVVISDLSEQTKRKDSEANLRETEAIIRHLIEDRSSLANFCDETSEIIKLLSIGSSVSNELDSIRDIEQAAVVFGLERLAKECSRLETLLTTDGGRTLTVQEKENLETLWEQNAFRIRNLLKHEFNSRINVATTELEDLLRLTVGRALPEDISSTLKSWRFEPIGSRLMYLTRQAQNYARRRGKNELRVKTEGRDIRLPRRELARFWGGLTHVIHNAIDHGIESADIRLAAGKPESGVLELVVQRTSDGGVLLRVADDGAGIDWGRLKTEAEKAGLPAESQQDLLDALFATGVSTGSSTTPPSMRGLGMSVVQKTIKSLGGRIEITSATGEGTSFEFYLPRELLTVTKGELSPGEPYLPSLGASS